jgi:ParB family chromosome partitioning protein
MTNPFTKSLDEFRGQHVRAVSHDGRTYEGFVERLHHHNRHVVLRGATTDDGTYVGRVLVSHVDVLETTEPTGRVERIALHAIEPAPYHAREFDAADDRGYIARVRSDGWAGSFPTVRPTCGDGDLEHPGDRGFEIVEGHKRIWVANEAGLNSHPVHIIEIDDWTATRRFAADHLPTESDLRGNGESHDGYYTHVEIEAAINSLLERWSGRALDIDRVVFNVARLDLQHVVKRTRDVDESIEEIHGRHDDGGDREGYPCIECGREFDSPRGLAIHRGHKHKHGTTKSRDVVDTPGDESESDDDRDADGSASEELLETVGGAES